MENGPAPRFVRFGSFELDLKERKLTKMGGRIPLQEQPLRLLVLLLERQGQLVTREEIRERLWQDLYVEFDGALNTATRKLREALNDSADTPRFLETVPRQGYRFVAPVLWSPEISKELRIPVTQGVRRNWYFSLFGVGLVVVGGVFALWHTHHAAPKINPQDTIVLADFSNNTGDSVFDDALPTALRLAVREAPLFKVLPDSQRVRTLQRMTVPADTKVTAEVARELCQRSGSKAYLMGSIDNLGSHYVLGLKAVNCRNGDTLAQAQSVAESKEGVLNALGEAASKLREELGESLASVQKFDVPLARATTSSMEALRLYSLGLKAFTEKGPADSIPYFQRVVDIDPDFAAGYRALGLDYTGLGQTDRAREYYSKAFQLQGHVGEWERLAITADYYLNVTGELDKAAATYSQWIDSYPGDDGAYSTLGMVYALEGQYEKAADMTRRALGIAPSFASYGNLAIYDLALQHFDEGGQVIDQARAKGIDGFEFRTALYALAFHGADSTAMAEQQRWFAGRPEEHLGLSLTSDTEAYRGHLRVARELTTRAADSAIRADSKESGAIWLANAALREAAFGNFGEARQAAAKALKLARRNPGAEAEAGLAFAMAGDGGRAESLAQELRTRFPLDTQMRSLWLPAIRAQLALGRKDSAYTFNDSQSGSSVEYGAILFAVNTSCLYPTYIRGEAYLAAGRGKEANAEFQKILDHSGLVWSCWTGALARLGSARANALQAKTSQGAEADAVRAKALVAYKDFLELWKDADSDIPVYRQAQAEYAKLQ